MTGLIAILALTGGLILLFFGAISAAAFDVLFAILMGQSLAGLLCKLRKPRLLSQAIGAGLAMAAILATLLMPAVRLAPYLAVFMINGFMAFVFARGVMSQNEPLILQVIRIGKSGPEGSPAFHNYVYWQSWCWVILGTLTCLAGLAGMLRDEARLWAGQAITVLLLFQIFWFVVTHAYARAMHARPETWLLTLRLMSKPSVWLELKI